MLFNSVQFLVFFPAVVLVYFVLPHRWRWAFLLAASYYFYACWSLRYLLLLIASTVTTWLSGLFISKAAHMPGGARYKKICVALSFTINLGILFFFKYFNFALTSLNTLLLPLGVQLVHPSFSLLLPVGISFYTFQALSYTMDVYRGELACERNLGKYALFVSFFPQLVAGPIERSKNLLEQFDEVHRFSAERARDGLLLMLWGFFQKVLIADRVAILVDSVYNGYGEQSGAVLVAAALLFAFQIYCDFAGYSNIAIGAAQVMGFRLMDNFRQPCLARSIQDFWQRWHISLSTWFRDYLYIPLGGSRCGRPRRYLNLMITFLVSGLWHGARWSYVVWGGLHGAFQIVGDATRGLRSKVYSALRINQSAFLFRLGQGVFTFCLVSFALIFFRAPGLGATLDIFHIIVTNFNPQALLDGSLLALGLDLWDFVIMLCSLAVLMAAEVLQSRGPVRAMLARRRLPLRWAFVILGVMSVLIFGVYGYSYSPHNFIYFQF